jgi:hypothetical protein
MIGQSVAQANAEVVSRFGTATAEYLKAYRGVDNETGQKLAKGLRDLAKSKVHPDFAAANLKQQSGFAAEIIATAQDNSESIIIGSPRRVVRSDDLASYGRNHNVVDRVTLVDGKILVGSETQMKFVGNRDLLLSRIAKPNGKFARYRGYKIELPTEQFEGAADHCREKAAMLRARAGRAKTPEASEALLAEAGNYEELAGRIQDAGLTSDEALRGRTQPIRTVGTRMLNNGHRAGVESAKSAALIGGVMLTVSNGFQVICGKKDVGTAAKDVATGTAGVVLGAYAGTVAATITKSFMQQATSGTVRQLSRTSLPGAAIEFCLSLRTVVTRYVRGECDERAVLREVGNRGCGVFAGAAGATVGQALIPVPVVGALVGSLVGCLLSSLIYEEAIDALADRSVQQERRQRLLVIHQESMRALSEERVALQAFLAREYAILDAETGHFLSVLTAQDMPVDEFAIAVNGFGRLLGADLRFSNGREFDEFMLSDEPLRI